MRLAPHVPRVCPARAPCVPHTCPVPLPAPLPALAALPSLPAPASQPPASLRLRRPIRHDNQPELLLCLRCGHEAHRHLNLLHARGSELNARDRQPPPRQHKPAAVPTAQPGQEQEEREQEGLGREGANPLALEDASGTLV